MQQQALADLKVLELGRFVSAAFTSKLLAGYGAEVVKIEPPGTGDEARRHGPFPRDIPHPEKSGLFLYLNTNKLGITLSPGTATGRDLLLELLRQSDVLIENFQPGELEAWGLDYGTLRAVNPRLVVTSVTVFGREGPHKDHKGYAITAAAAGGVSYRMGDPARYPLTTPYDRSDLWGAMHAAGATMLAVMARELTGQGQHVDISSAEVLGSFINCMDIMTYLTEGQYHTREGRRLKGRYPWTLLRCEDGYYGFIAGQDRHWERFMALMGNPEWSKDPRYQDRQAMGQHPEEVDSLIEAWLANQSKAQVWARFREARLPYHPVLTIQEVTDLEHLRERGYWGQIEHPDAGRLEYTGAPFKMSETPWRLQRAAPRLGQHNEEVYCGRLGLSPAELAGLYQSGVI